jgi:glutathione S-transferase
VARFWEMAGIHPPAAELEAKRNGGTKALVALERHLAEHEFLVGERYSIADIALYAYTHVAPEGGFTLEPYPAVRAWLTRVAAEPGHISITD